jgi:hypothetical protein
MATAVHIPIDDLSSDARALIDRVETAGDIVIDAVGKRFRISQLPGPWRTAAESFELLKNSPNVDVEVDEDWSKDMAAVIALRYSEPDRDPWA